MDDRKRDTVLYWHKLEHFYPLIKNVKASKILNVRLRRGRKKIKALSRMNNIFQILSMQTARKYIKKRRRLLHGTGRN